MEKIIGVDCDEVLSESVRELLKTPFFVGKNIKREDMSSYNLWEIPQLNSSYEEAFSVFFDFFASECYWDIQPVLGAKEKLTLWKTQGHQLVVVTGRATQFEKRTKEWVHQYFPDLFDDFLFTNEMTNQSVPKSEICKQKGIELMIEDRLPTAIELSEHHIPCFLLDKPRNQGYKYGNYATIVKVSSRNDVDLSLLP